jgi:hypothetical protein
MWGTEEHITHPKPIEMLENIPSKQLLCGAGQSNRRFYCALSGK